MIVLAIWTSGQNASSQVLPGKKHKTLPNIIFVQAAVVHFGKLEQRFPKGSHLMRLELGTGPTKLQNLAPEFFAAADPAVSFDGTEILFSGRKSPDGRWQVWEMNAGGSNMRQLTHCSGDCLRPVYLPRGQVAFTAVTGKGRERSSAIYVSNEDGTNAHPITFGPGNFETETILHNGRLVVSADDPLVPNGLAAGSRALYLINPDGSELTLLRQVQHGEMIRTEVGEAGGGTVLFVQRKDVGGVVRGGRLAWIRRGRLHASLLTDPQTVYWSAHELGGDSLVVSKDGVKAGAGSGRFDLYDFNLKRKALGDLIYRDPKFSSGQAVPLAPHPVPRYYWSILHPEMKTGRLLCLDAYVSADAPRGRFSQRIAKVRVIALSPNAQREKTLGDAPVEKDGSFYLRVPSDRPIRFELLGAGGAVIHAQRSWIWVRPGEDRGCLGCHENPALTPGDHWPLALRRFNGPTPVGLAVRPQAAH